MNVPAFGALVRRKRGEARLTQETLAGDVFGDSTRKGDISRIENSETLPQEPTVKRLCAALKISPAEMMPIRETPSTAHMLPMIPALSREGLERLAALSEVPNDSSHTDDELRILLATAAQEHIVLAAEFDGWPDDFKSCSALRTEAQDAIDRDELEGAEALLSFLQYLEKKEAAHTAEWRAENALFRDKPEQAFSLLSDAADSFAILDPLEPAKRKINSYAETLFQHGQHYGGPALEFASRLLTSALTDRLRDTDSNLWASGKSNLSIILRTQASRTEGPEGTILLEDAVAACRDALTTYSQDDHPENWAIAQNNLANALSGQAARTEGPECVSLFAEAIAVFRKAQIVFTREDYPEDWAMAENNIAITLDEQAARTEGSDGATLQADAVNAYRAALTIFDREGTPVDWAAIQNNLARALRNQAARTEGPEGTALLADAVAACRDALLVRTVDTYPVDWAATQTNLTIALVDQAARTEGPEGTALLADAISNYRDAFTIRTRIDDPVQWAMTQNNLAIALFTRANRPETTDARADLTKALAAVDGALEVFDPVHLSYNHGTATRLRENIQAAIDAL